MYQEICMDVYIYIEICMVMYQEIIVMYQEICIMLMCIKSWYVSRVNSYVSRDMYGYVSRDNSYV